MLKKITMLAMAVAAVAAFAVPASASAATDWTDNGTIVKEGVDLTETYEGFLKFSVTGGSFGCQVTIKLTVTGPTKAEITQFTPTTTSCEATGVLVGCSLKNDSSNVPWDITNGAATLGITKAGGNVTVFNEYNAGCALGASSDLQFTEITATPTLEGGNVASFAISGTSTEGAVASGSAAAEGTKTIGLK